MTFAMDGALGLDEDLALIARGHLQI